MKVIVTHDMADFDAIASAVAVKKLYPDAILVLPNSLERSVRDYLKDSPFSVEFVAPSKVPMDKIELVVVVDTKKKDRSQFITSIIDKGYTPEFHIYDHHPAHPKDIVGDIEIIEETGACISIIVDIIRKRGIQITKEEATLFAIGLYQDTGCFTFNSTVSKDLEIGAFLVDLGADLNIVSDYVKRELTAEQIELLNEMLDSLERIKIAGIDVAITVISRDKYVGDLAVLAHKLRDMESITVLFVIARMDDRITLIARSRTDALDVGDIAAEFGGGGHATAASATIKDLTLSQVKERLLKLVKRRLEAVRTARDIMTSPPILAFCDMKLGDAEKVMVRYNINALPVVDSKTGELLGIITRQTVERALYHGLHDELVEDYMNSEIKVAHPDTTVKELEKIMLSSSQRMIPILDETKAVVGVVTRGELLKALYEDMVKTSISPNTSLYRKNIRVIMNERLPSWLMERIDVAKQVGERLGYNVYIVGGFVRDLLLRVENFDVDLVVEGDGVHFAREFAKELGARVNVHEKFETAVIILPDGSRIDVATARLEYYEGPAALPKVARGSIKRDLYRRDFTINAMAIKITGDDAYTLIDYYGGLRDLKDKAIRVIHNLSFVEDPTRAFRAVRFEQRYGFRIGGQTERLIKIAVRDGLFEKLSGKRIFSELKHMMEEKEAFNMVRRMDQLGILRFIHPELKADEDKKEIFHSIREVIGWYELLYLDEHIDIWILNLSALLSNIGHRSLRKLLKRFGLAKKDAEKVEKSVLYCNEVVARLSNIDDPADIYKTLKDYPTESLLFFMARAPEDVKRKISNYLLKLRSVHTEIKGRDLVNMGLTPGPKIGFILNKLLEAKLRGMLKTREDEIRYVESILREHPVGEKL